MRRIISVLAVMAAMLSVMAVPAFAQDATTGDDNSVDNSNNIIVRGDDNQVGLNSSSQTLNQNVTQNSNQEAIVMGDGEIAQGGNSVSATQNQYNVNFLADDSFNDFFVFYWL